MAAGYSQDIINWLQTAARFLASQWGLDTGFAGKAAELFLYLNYYGLQPQITSGFRSPEKQLELLSRYNAGDPGVLVKPATSSKHSYMRLGKPAALAIDISNSNHSKAAIIAESLGIKAGFRFSDPDGVHFYV